MQMTDEQILYVNGWKIKEVRFYSCGFCHRTVSGKGWVSPKFKSYHLGCAMKAPQVKRLLTKHAPDVVESAASSDVFPASEVPASQGESTPATTQVM